MTFFSVLTLLSLGLAFGLKHAIEIDHVVAVSTIVSQHRNVFRSAMVGALWGLGHTASILIVGALVLVFRISISPLVAGWLEFGVALMIIVLGLMTLIRILKRRADVHVHRHYHNGVSHVHVHFHEPATEHSKVSPTHSHAISRVGIKPFLVGAMHGLAGSAALTLLVVSQVNSVVLGIFYLGFFGLGAIAGMLLMSSVIGLPFALSGRRLTGLNYGLQLIAGILTIGIGLWYAFEVGKNSNLLGF